jgi:catechol 2,3-dioxygenase-like lactoylglutathione lyase family enzyme
VLTTHRFDHVGISVADLDTAIDWYGAAFGLTVESRFEVPHSGLRGVMLRHGSGYRIEFLERPGSVPGPRPAHPDEAALTRGYGHLCLCVDNVGAAYESLIAAGAESRVPPRPAPRAGATMAWVADPEGNLIELLDRL